MAQEAEWRREQEARARERAAQVAAQGAGARERRLATTPEEMRRNEESLRAARAREQQVLDAYAAGQSNMRAIIRENQERTITQMYDSLNEVGPSTEDALHFLLEQEASEEVGANPGRHRRIMALEDNLAHIQKLTQELTMLKSALDVPGEGYYARLERMFA